LNPWLSSELKAMNDRFADALSPSTPYESTGLARTHPGGRLGPSLLALLLGLAAVSPSTAESVELRAGTPVYVELEEAVSSKLNENVEGDSVRAHLWRDVVVGDRTALAAGSPVEVLVSRVRKAKMATKAGNVELRAISVPAQDGSVVDLEGGYDGFAQGAKHAAASAGAAVTPLLFVKGRTVRLEAGVVFDAQVATDRTLALRDAAALPATAADSGLTVELFYDDIVRRLPGSPIKTRRLLPVRLRLCGADLEQAEIVTVNGVEIEPQGLLLGPRRQQGSCQTSISTIDLKALGKYLNLGFNLFEVETGTIRQEVLLELEL